MRLNYRELKHLRVKTRSDAMLGHVRDLVLDTEGQMVAQYEVKSSLLSGKTYLINRDQVVRFEEKKMIVDDNVETLGSTPKEKPSLPLAPEGAAMRQKIDIRI